jgi:hypothetical protein
VVQVQVGQNVVQPCPSVLMPQICSFPFDLRRQFLRNVTIKFIPAKFATSSLFFFQVKARADNLIHCWGFVLDTVLTQSGKPP